MKKIPFLSILVGRYGRPGYLDQLRFFMGPAVEKSCYEVGEETRESFGHLPWQGEIFEPKGAGRYLLDLKLGIRLSLEHDGIAPDHIGDTKLCTFCNPELFPSYRRDGRTGERILSFLLLR